MCTVLVYLNIKCDLFSPYFTGPLHYTIAGMRAHGNRIKATQLPETGLLYQVLVYTLIAKCVENPFKVMWILHFNGRFALPITSIPPCFWTLSDLFSHPRRVTLCHPSANPLCISWPLLTWSCLCPLFFLPASKSIFCLAVFTVKCIDSYRKSMLLLPSSDLCLLMRFGGMGTSYIWKAPAAL